MDDAVEQTGVEKPETLFLSKLRAHFGTDPIHLPDYGTEAKEGPVEYINIELHDNRVLACAQAGLYLVHQGKEPVALLISGPPDWHTTVDLEVMALEPAKAEHVLATLRTNMRANNVYRSHVVSLAPGGYNSLEVHFHHLPSIDRGNIILPQGVLDRVERQTIGFAQHSERLKAVGRHIKRGLLLYGPPGTGKTLTAMYLANQMPGRTILLLTGRSVGLLVQAALIRPSRSHCLIGSAAGDCLICMDRVWPCALNTYQN